MGSSSRLCTSGILKTGAVSPWRRLSKRHARPIHLLVTDVTMPKMNGRQLAQALVGLHPMMKVLFISGHDDAASCGGANPEGAALLTKPFTPDVLARKARELLDKRS